MCFDEEYSKCSCRADRKLGMTGAQSSTPCTSSVPGSVRITQFRYTLRD